MSTSEPQDAFGVVLFRSTQAAIRAEKLLTAAGVTFKLIPVPRHLSADCGFCLRFSWDERERITSLLADLQPLLQDIERLDY